MNTTRLKPGSRVTLRVPENPHLDGQLAVVVSLTEWGAHVDTKVGSGQFRALESEMLLVADADAGQSELPGVRENGYTGNVCSNCQSSRMVRRGPCEYCEDCGTASGGCG